MIDCLILGHHDADFADYVRMVRAMDPRSGAYRDLDLAFIEHEGKPYRALDILSRLQPGWGKPGFRPFFNTDQLWPTITYLGSYLARHGFTFDYVNAFHLQRETLRQKLLAGNVRTVAITTTLYVSPHPILEIVSFIRGLDTGVEVVLGGPYIANQAAMATDEASLCQLFDFLGADYYVISQEGELALGRLLRALKEGGDLSQVDNLAYRRHGRFVRTASSREANALEENPVDYSLFPTAEIGEFVALRTAKSCPFACSFCGFPKRAGKYVFEGVEAVERHLDALRAVGTVSTLTFLDDTFNVPPKRFRELLQMMIRNGYGFHWNSFYRSDHGDAETIELMARAGCEGVFLGVESGSDSMLKRMNKTSRRHNYLQAIPAFREAGISTYASLIVGFPGETLETVQESWDLVEETRPDFFRAQLWYCDPMTPIWDRREELGVRGSAFNWTHDTMDVATACDLIDRLFLSVTGSLWLPQWGFEQWSTFYLQRRGMPIEQVKTFVRSFNALVREKLVHGGESPAHAELMERLALSCRFDAAGDGAVPRAPTPAGGALAAAAAPVDDDLQEFRF